MSQLPEEQRLITPTTLTTTIITTTLPEPNQEPNPLPASVVTMPKEEITFVNYENEEKNLLLIPGLVENNPTLIAVDTCSSTSLIALELARKLKRKWERCDTYINTLASQTATEGKMNVKIKIAYKELEITCLIVKGLPAGLLLGNDALGMLKPKIDYEKKRMKIGSKYLDINLTTTPGDFTLALTAQEIRIPALTATFVELKSNRWIPDSTEVLYEPTSAYNTSRTLLVTKSARGSVSFMNLTNRELVIPGNTPIGRFEKIAEREDCYFTWKNSEEEPRINIEVDTMEHLHELVCRVEGQLTEEELESLHQLLLKNADLFTKDLRERVGKSVHQPHVIDTGDTKPLKVAQYRLPREHMQAVEEQTQEMLGNNVIRPSSSPWSFPVLLVKKKDGSLRFCVDFRKLNEVTKKDAYALPRIDDILDSLGGKRYFSTLDLASGYWQIPILEEHKEKTAFRTRSGLYEFNVMPFGLTNAPATFQRDMDLVLSGLNWELCLVYMDDVIVFSETFERHLEDLQKVFDRIRTAEMFIKVTKCNFCCKELEFLGHIVSEDGIRPNPKITKSIQDATVPDNVEEVQKFLGLTGYYRRFVKDYAKICEPLSSRLKKGAKFGPNPEVDHAVSILKEKLMSPPILAYPNFEKPFILYTDASNMQIAGILSQKDEQGRERVITYLSRKLHGPEFNYSVTELECLSLVTWVKALRQYLGGGREFTVITDHYALQWLHNNRDYSSKLMRWSLALQDYNFKVIHRPGSSHRNVDALTRPPFVAVTTRKKEANQTVMERAQQRKESVNEYKESTQVEDQEEEEEIRLEKKSKHKSQQAPQQKPVEEGMDDDLIIENEQQKQSDDSDPYLKEGEFTTNLDEDSFQKEILKQYINHLEKDSDLLVYKKYLQNKELPPDEKTATHTIRECTDMIIDKGVLYRIITRGGQVFQLVCVPQGMRSEVLNAYHDDFISGHFAVKRMWSRLRNKYFWRNMYQSIRDYVASCPTCQERRANLQKYGLLKSIITTRPFEQVHIDILGPLPQTTTGNRYVLVFIDHFSKYVEAAALVETTAVTIARQFISRVFCRHGAPECITTDRGRNFLSEVLKSVNECLGVKHNTTTAYHPQANGMVERFNATLLKTLSMYVSPNQDNWDIYLDFAQAAYNFSPQESTGFSPHRMIFGKEPVLPVDINLGALEKDENSDFLRELKHRLSEVCEQARCNLESARVKQAKYYNQGRTLHDLQSGDKVLLYNPAIQKGTQKLNRPWKGPYTIQEVSDLNATIVNDENPKDIQKVHVQRLKKFLPPVEGHTVETQGNQVPESSSYEYVVEAILGHRLRSGETEYLVKFAGFTNRYNLWLPLVNLSNSEDIVRAYHASLALQGFQRTENP